MTETITIEHEMELDDLESQMLDALREEHGQETVESDLCSALINEQAARQAIHNGYQMLRNGQGQEQ